MTEWDYLSSAVKVPLRQADELSDLGHLLAEYVHGARKQLQGEGGELVSHDLLMLGDQPVLTLIFRRPERTA